jgi:hypothetical protein
MVEEWKNGSPFWRTSWSDLKVNVNNSGGIGDWLKERYRSEFKES